MPRYLIYIQLWFIKALEYRAELSVWVLLTLLNTLVLLAIWISVFTGVDSLRGYQLSQLLQYFVLATIINGVTASHFEHWRAQEIKEGKIDHYLTKPLAYPLQVLLADIGNRLFYMSLIIPTTILIALLVSWGQPLTALDWRPVAVLSFLFLLLVGYLIEFSFALAAVFLTFWFESAEGLEHFKWITITVFSGFMIPVEFMPVWLRQVVEILPFKYMYAVPIQILQQKRSLNGWDLLYLGVLLVVISAGLRWLWQKTVTKYVSSG